MLDFVAVQRTVQCQHCTAKHGTPPYIDLPASQPSAFQPASHPTHCPRCGRTRTIRPYDYADTLCQDYFGLSRAAAIAAIQLYNELKQSDIQRPTKKLSTLKAAYDIYDYLNQTGVRRMLQRGYIAPLDCTCKSCGGQFTMLRGLVDTTQTTPIYCVWCGKANTLITDPTQTEDTAWIVLSQNYNLPLPALKVFYSQWSTKLSQHSTFAGYMQTEEVQQLLPMLQQAQPA